MSTTPTSPPALDGSAIPPVPSVKLSDLNAINQYLLARAGVTLTATGLTATASGLLAPMLPDLQQVAPGAYPLPLYLVAILLPVGALSAISTIPLSLKLQMLLMARLYEAGTDKDWVSHELRDEFTNTFKEKLYTLGLAQRCLFFGLLAIFAYLYPLLVLRIGIGFSNQAPANQPSGMDDSILRFTDSYPVLFELRQSIIAFAGSPRAVWLYFVYTVTLILILRLYWQMRGALKIAYDD